MCLSTVCSQRRAATRIHTSIQFTRVACAQIRSLPDLQLRTGIIAAHLNLQQHVSKQQSWSHNLANKGVLQERYKDVAQTSQRRYTDVTRTLQGHYKDIAQTLKGRYKEPIANY